MTKQHTFLQSLQEGHWFKLICGASFHHLSAVRNLALVYTLAGADCIDVAADPAVVLAVKEAIAAAISIQISSPAACFSRRVSQPLLMVSLNDGEDPHFRKAEFSAIACPKDCLRPCELICPANAITETGVIAERCYGCGRCLPVCPIQHIYTRSYVSTAQAIAPLILEDGVDAIEIHTQVGRLSDFRRLWNAIEPLIGSLKLLAISCPDGEGLIDYLRALYDMIAPLPCALIWQTDGRPMSGDIGMGTTKAAIRLGQRVLDARLPGYVQLAGGTNAFTVPKLRSLQLLHPTPTSMLTNHEPCHNNDHVYIAGVAYGSYARALLAPVLDQLTATLSPGQPTFALSSSFASHDTPPLTPSLPHQTSTYLESYPQLLEQAIRLAHSLVSQLKPGQKAISLGSNSCLDSE